MGYRETSETIGHSILCGRGYHPRAYIRVSSWPTFVSLKMPITAPNFSLQFIVLMCITSLASPGFASDWIRIPSQFQVELNDDGESQTFEVALQAVTVSDSYLWGIDDRASNKFPPGNLVRCARPCTDGNWIDGNGALD